MPVKQTAQISDLQQKQKSSLEWLSILHKALMEIAAAECFFEESQELQHIAKNALSKFNASVFEQQGGQNAAKV